MANTKAKLYYTSSKHLQTLPVKNGNIIFVPDINTVCLDMSGQRFSYSTIKNFATDAERAETPFPNEGFYFVEETNVLWQWHGGIWSQVTPSNLNPVVYGESEDAFPQLGKKDTLYYTDDGIYNWKDQLNKYNLIANANRWNGI